MRSLDAQGELERERKSATVDAEACRLEMGSDWEDRRILIEQVRKLQGELEQSTAANAQMEVAMEERMVSAVQQERAGLQSSNTQAEVLITSLEVRPPYNCGLMFRVPHLHRVTRSAVRSRGLTEFCRNAASPLSRQRCRHSRSRYWP